MTTEAELIERLQDQAAAHWIWSQRDEREMDRMAQFRLAFDWDGTGPIAWTGFADTLYMLWCNGAAIGVGPVAGVSARPYLTRWDLSDHVRPGRNLLALQVWSTAGDIACCDVCSLEGGVIGWLEAGDTIVPTGTAWQARDAWRFNRPPRADDSPATRRQHGQPAREEARVRLLLADLRDEPLDWMQPDADDGAGDWQPARLVHGFQHPRREHLRLSPVPPLTCEQLPEPRLLDLGWAQGGQPVRHAHDVAAHVWAQRHESLLCPPLPLRHPMARISPDACGLPDPTRLGWDALSTPWRCPQPPADTDCYLTLDLGRETSGCLLLDLTCAADCCIDIGYADHLSDRRVEPVQQFHYADRIVVAAGRHSLRLPHDRGCRYLQLTLSTAATITWLRWEEHVFPHDRSPRFDSSDCGLNAVWQAAADTVRQISLWGYVDNAWRERHQWLGTELVHAWRGGYAVAGDLELTRKNLIDALEYAAERDDGLIAAAALGNNNGPWQRVLEAHDLCFPQTAHAYLLHSDDQALAPALTDACARLLAHQAVFTEQGLKAPTDPERTLSFSGWNFNAGHSVITSHNLLFIESVRATAALHRTLGQHDQAAAVAAMEEPLVRALWRELVDDQRGVLCQGLDPTGRRVPFCSQHDNARALALGIVPAHQIETLRRFSAGPSGTWPSNRSGWQGGNPRGDHIRYHPEQMVVASSPFESLAVIDAIAAIESPQAAVDYIRYHFGAMVDEGPGTLWECWSQHLVEDATCSYSQGWGTAVAYQILQYALGAEVTAAGGQAITWRPRQVAVQRLQAKLRTIHGDVSLGWDGDELQWDLPAGVQLTIDLPGGEEHRVQGPAQGKIDERA
ncbi:MAG: hypothetical protein ACOCX2_00015 [Armatimonadota bacterium]